MTSDQPRPEGGDVDHGTVDFRALFEALPTAFLVMTPDLVMVEANAAYLAVVGRTREEIVGRPVFEVFPPTADLVGPDGRNPIQATYERVRDTGLVVPMPIQEYAITDPATGEVAPRHWSLISAPVLDADGRVVLVLQRTEDVTDYVRERDELRSADGGGWRRRAEEVQADLYLRLQELQAAQAARDVAARRLARLAEVALALTAAQTVEDLERIVIDGGLAGLGVDGGAVVSESASGGWRITVSAALGDQVQLAYGELPYDSPLPACATARTGRRLLLPTRASGLAFHPAMEQVYADTRREGWAFLPLAGPHEVLGALALSWPEEHVCAPDELELLDTFAAQCAQALQRIRATESERRSARAARRMSEALQRSLLTQPTIAASLEVAVRYRPAAQEAQVGGDWYDAFTTAAGATLLVVGDVSGHDRTAAATMGQVRNLLRGAAYDSDDSPGVLLTRLDAALAGLQLESLATAVVARLEQGPTDRERGVRRLRWSNAGHPPPMLRRPDGEVEVLGGEHDLLLGVDPGTPRGEHLVELPAGSTLLLYTDGLVERRAASLGEGIAGLAKAFEVEGWRDPEVLADLLLATVSPEAVDDVALLALRCTDPGDAPDRRRAPS